MAFILLVTSNHQTTNFVFPNFSTNFSQFGQLKKQTNFLLVQNRFFLDLDQWKVCFLFQLLNWEKSVEKIGENKIGGLVVWCHEQDKWRRILSNPKVTEKLYVWFVVLWTRIKIYKLIFDRKPCLTKSKIFYLYLSFIGFFVYCKFLFQYWLHSF